jgi:hypothetical protein
MKNVIINFQKPVTRILLSLALYCFRVTYLPYLTTRNLPKLVASIPSIGFAEKE